jgi:hypothetical protein
MICGTPNVWLTYLSGSSEQAASSIPRACYGWAETMAAYRFVDNARVSCKEILSGHQRATQAQVQAQAVVLLR